MRSSVMNLDDLTRRGLYLSDIPLHDATRDLVLLGEQFREEYKLTQELEILTDRLQHTLRALEDEKKKTDRWVRGLKLCINGITSLLDHNLSSWRRKMLYCDHEHLDLLHPLHLWMTRRPDTLILKNEGSGVMNVIQSITLCFSFNSIQFNCICLALNQIY